MPYSDEEAMEIVGMIAKELQVPKEISGVRYRDDYWDYQFVLTDKTHCEIREKLIDVFAETGDDDARREIEFRLTNSIPLEEWELIDWGFEEFHDEDGGDGIDVIQDV